MKKEIPLYFVLCREDTKPDGSPGKYVVATQRPLLSLETAQNYAASISPSRVPLVVRVLNKED